MDNGKIRCPWAESSSLMQAYHDSEWGRICHDDQYLFEMLTLEGAQAGLSWQSILQRREGYRQAFHRFQIHKVAEMTDEELSGTGSKSIRSEKMPEWCRHWLGSGAASMPGSGILQKESPSWGTGKPWRRYLQSPICHGRSAGN